MTLSEPKLSGEQLFGLSDLLKDAASEGTLKELAMPLDDILRLAIRTGDGKLRDYVNDLVNPLPINPVTGLKYERWSDVPLQQPLEVQS